MKEIAIYIDDELARKKQIIYNNITVYKKYLSYQTFIY